MLGVRAQARKWMTAMGLSREQGNNMAAFIVKAHQHTQGMSANEREYYKDQENLRMERIFGPDWHDTQLKPAARMIAEIERLHPGLTAFVKEHGDNASLIMELTKAARIYDARKGR